MRKYYTSTVASRRLEVPVNPSNNGSTPTQITVPPGGIQATVTRVIKPDNLLEVTLPGGERAVVKPEDMTAVPTTTTVVAVVAAITTPAPSGGSWIPLLLVGLAICILCILAVVCCLNQKPEKKKKPKKRALKLEPEIVEAPAPAPVQAVPQWLTAPILSVSAAPPVTTHVVQPVMQQQPQIIQYAAPAQYASAPAVQYAAPQAASMVLQPQAYSGSMVATEPVAGRHFG